MAQGKLKVKAKLPKNVKGKKDAKKGVSVTKRASEYEIFIFLALLQIGIQSKSN